MAELSKNCYDCGKTCINSQFCYDGGSVSNSISLPRTLKIKIIANPEFWGFGGGYDQNVLVSGYAYFSNGRYDFFDGYDEDHYGVKQCGSTLVGSFRNEQRPDVGYRSVYDDETGRSHYNGTTPNDVMRGGAEVYLLDRTATKTTDQNSCDETDPQEVFKKSPDNFGLGNKILFNDEIYKNITGAWRLNSCNNCYPTGIVNSLRNLTCSGDPKQHIFFDEHFSTKYDPARNRCLSDKYSSEQECQPDGTTPKEYQGQIVSLIRDTGVSPFITATISYFGGAASGLRNGQQLLIIDSGNQFYNAYHIFDVTHSSNTQVKLMGSLGNSNLSYTGSTNDKWIALGTIDPESCCGGAAFGVDNTHKKKTNQPVYHVDIGKIFNNSKNKIFSNRGKYQNSDPRTNRSTVVVSGDSPLLIDDNVINPRKLPYFGPYYELNEDLALRFFNEDNTIVHKNNTCYTKSQTLEIFTDCLTQSYEYESCEQNTKHYQNNVPRLAFRYRPCNYNDSCSFNESGLPYTAGANGMPSSLQDLKNGFGGQEIVMYINVGDAWGKEIGRRPCSCEGTPPGTNPPDVITIKSPITYPCFPKFDLRPSGYGCRDDLWISYAKNYLGILETGQCDTIADFNACWTKQPYTTYGYIRNLCGHESHSRKEVILSLSERMHAGDYNDIAPNLSTVEPLYVTFTTPSDQTGSGYPVNGSTGVMPYWGLSDSDGRLAYPYFPTKISSMGNYCSSGSFDYIDFDSLTAFSGGFPKEGVPFLIEIDHDDYCVGCETSQIELKDYSITIESMHTKFYHGLGQITGSETYNSYSYKYGFNHCKYPGNVVEPYYDSNNDVWKLSTCSGNITDQSLYELSKIYTGETCECLGSGGITTTLHLNKLTGTDIPKYWSSSGISNSYVKYGDCGYSFTVPKYIFDLSGPFITYNFDVYFSSRMMCGDDNIASYSRFNGATYSILNDQGLGRFYDCGACSHSYPATESKPNIFIDWMYVNRAYTGIFDKFTDSQIKNPSVYDFIRTGAERGTFSCGSITPTTSSTCNCADDASQIAWANKFGSSCFAFSGERIIKWDTNIPGCHGSRVILYGWSNWKTSSSRFTSNCATWHPYNGYNQVTPVITCENSNICYSGANDKFFGDYMVTTGNFSIGSCTFSPSDLNVGGNGLCGALEVANACISLNECCAPEGATDLITGLPLQTNPYIKNEYPLGYLASGAYNGNNNCYLTEVIPMGEFTYYEFSTRGSGSICSDGWYGEIYADHDAICRNTLSPAIQNTLLAWEGFDIPNLGHVSGIKFEDPIAITASEISAFLNGRGYPSQVTESVCAYDQSVNKTIQIDSEFIIPGRSTEWGTDVHLAPINCNVLAGPTGNRVEVGSTCVKPIPFNTFNNGGMFGGGDVETETSLKVDVIKRACFPEIMTVHKIECNGGVYALHVSREYYEHDRNLYTVDAYIDENTNLIVANKEILYGRIDGGQTINKYTCGTVPNQTKSASICSTGDGCVLDDTMDYFGLLPKFPETDSVTPCYPITCVTGVNPFVKSLCANYEVNGTSSSDGGRGGSGYFEVLPAFSGSPTGCLNFVITNPGSGYYSSLFDSGTNSILVTGCAIPYFDRPSCVSLTLKVYPNTAYDKRFDVSTQSLVANTGSFNSQYFVYSGAISYTDCGGYGNQCAFFTGIYPVTFGPCISEEVNLSCELSTETCENGTQYYPNLYNGGSGTYLWKFYNLFYDSGYLGGLALDDADPDSNVWFVDSKPGDKAEPFPFNIRYNASPRTGRTEYQSKNTNQIPLAEIIPFSETGIKCLHSCIQDHTTCGGSFFCNKEFFPRRSYLTGTYVTKFAPFSMCVQNGVKSFGNWLDGHIDDDFIDTYEESVLGENSQKGWLDPCNSGSRVELLSNVGINDHIIYVNDITPLIGSKHPYYKMLNPEGLDTKSCVVPVSGCFDFLGTHNARTIAGIATKTFETGDTETYTEIKESGCLFEPFKIFVDTQCCQERLGHPGTEDPMYLSWISQGIPAGACKGWVSNPLGKSCVVTDCHNRSLMLREFVGLSEIDFWFVEGAAPTGCPQPGYYFFQQPPACTGAPFFYQRIADQGCCLAILYRDNYYVIRKDPTAITSSPLKCADLCRVETNKVNHCNIYDDSIYAGNGASMAYLGANLFSGSGVNFFGASGCSSLNCSNINYCSQFYTSGDLDCNFVGGIVAELQQTTHFECQYPSVLKLTVTE